MVDSQEPSQDRAKLAVPAVGALVETADPFEPYRLLDSSGGTVAPVRSFLADLQAAGRSASTQRSYGMDLLRWFRFCWAAQVVWDEATQAEARDFIRRMQLVEKPGLRHQGPSASRLSASPNPITGKMGPGPQYAPSTVAHCETVLRHFYDFHLQSGTGPFVNPFPLDRGRRARGANTHRSPIEPARKQRSGRYRPTLHPKVPRSIPDEKFNELFAALPSLRDRALVAFWISTGARASELLSARQGDADPGQQLITVVRKGSRALQALPASPDAFVWLRLYQAQIHRLVPHRRDEPLWWTLRKPLRELTYPAARAMFVRANAVLGSNWTLHDLRHSAAYRMARDPEMPLTDVQWVLGHAQLSTTQIYMNAPVEEVIASVLGHFARRAAGPQARQEPTAPWQYNSESLDVLFRRDQP